MPRRLDSAQVDRLFNEVQKEVYKLPRASMKAVTLIPVAPAARGAKTISYKLITEMGMAKIIADYSQDLPPVARLMEEKFVPIFDIGTSYGYSLHDVEAAAFAEQTLELDMASTARYAVERKEDALAWKGDALHGVIGFINAPGITGVTLDAGASSSVLWRNKTSKEIVSDVSNVIVNGVKLPTNEVEVPDTVLLPTEAYADVSTRSFGGEGTMTVLEFLKKTFPEITKWESVGELNGAGAAGTDRMMVYTRATTHVCQVMPITFEQMPVQAKALAYSVPCRGRSAGTIVKRPLSVAYADGI
jgi:hypothetical protein